MDDDDAVEEEVVALEVVVVVAAVSPVLSYIVGSAVSHLDSHARTQRELDAHH